MAIGVYVHIPFCARKCNYCDFNSHVSDYCERERYIRSLCDEIRSFSAEDMSVDTIYFGGGTPTILSPNSLTEILDTIFSVFSVEKNCEITTECNPATIDADGFSVLKKGGFNRISFGMQSANANELKALGRIHSFDDCRAAVNFAIGAGFENISADLMFGIPKQSIESFKSSLNAVAELGVTHISCYGLKVEDGTPFAEMNVEVDEDFSRDLYDKCVEILSEKGYERYEISNFAKSGFESRHNLKYWKCDDFIGFGAGAYSCINGKRFSNIYDTEKYIFADNKVENVTELSDFDMMSEFVFLGLRTDFGISEAEFEKRFHKSIFDVFGNELDKNLKRNTIKKDGDRIYIPSEFIYVSNAILQDFV